MYFSDWMCVNSSFSTWHYIPGQWVLLMLIHLVMIVTTVYWQYVILFFKDSNVLTNLLLPYNYIIQVLFLTALYKWANWSFKKLITYSKLHNTSDTTGVILTVQPQILRARGLCYTILHVYISICYICTDTYKL